MRRTLLALIAVGAFAAPGLGATAQLVVMSTNPNGVPAAGSQYLLGVQVSGLAAPAFLGLDKVTMSGNLGRNTSATGTPYASPSVLFQTEADLANTNDPANYKRTSDSYFASPWRTLIPSPNGANETATSMFLEAGVSNAGSGVVNNGTFAFAYVNVTGAPGVLITGMFAIGEQAAPIGDGFGLRLTPGGQLNSLTLSADFAPKNNAVDGGDYATWRAAFGTSAAADTDNDGDSDGVDFLTWQQQFGSTVGTALAAGSAVPEPATGAMAAGCLLLLTARRRARLASRAAVGMA